MSEELNAIMTSADAFLSQGRYAEAADIYAHLSRRFPLQPDLHHVHALVLLQLAQCREALRQVDRAIALNPSQPAFHRSRGDILTGAGDLPRASEAYLSALALQPKDVNAMINLGNVLHAQASPVKALQWYRKAASLDPVNLMALNNIGKLLHDQGAFDQAMHWYEKALSIDPNYAEARFNRSVALLAQGDYTRGWTEYEWRFRRKAAQQVYPRQLKAPLWDGSSYRGKRLLVHCEQGLGDVIQFCRYLPQVKSLGGTLIVEAHAPLISLLAAMPAIDRVVPFSTHGHPPVEFDLYAPLLSLPRIFRTDTSNIPNHVPYLAADPQKVSVWRSKMGATNGLQIGVVWSGSAVDPQRSCPLELLATVFDHPGTQFFSLQTDLTAQSLRRLWSHGNVTHWGDRLKNFGDTAAAMINLDLVISIDTAAAHLAGALGKPVWILLPAVADWRWLLGRRDSPWYPSARLFRQQKAGDWATLLRRVSAELNHEVAVRNAFNRGCAQHEADRLDAAIDAYTQTIGLAPGLEPAHRNLGLAHFQKGDPQKAAICYERSLELKPDAPDVLTNLGAAYQHLHQPATAQTCYAKALELNPVYVPAIYNLGNLFLDQGMLDAAADQYRRALAVKPDHISCLCNMGRTLHRLGRLDEALHVYERALKISPRHPETRFNRAVTRLLQGQWSDGWPDYNWRFKCHNRHRIYPHQLPGKRWQGQPFKSETLLVHGEQGLGDALQFVRFLPWVKRLGGRVILETHRSLLSLFRNAAGIDALIELSPSHPPAPDYDWYVPLCSLPELLDLTPENLPVGRPYLFAQENKIRQWRACLPSKGVHVGLVWAGSNTYPERSCQLQDLAPLGQIKGINWIGLQKGAAAAQIKDPELDCDFGLTNWGEGFDDFSDTAAAIASLDLIISIDTSVAHLAGALGKPVWLLLPKVPDWRWLLHRPDTPWYASMRLFRQKQSGDWRSVVAAVGAMLDRYRHVQKKQTVWSKFCINSD